MWIILILIIKIQSTQINSLSILIDTIFIETFSFSLIILRIWKKISFDFKIKKLMFICLKSDVLIWYNAKLTEIEKNFFRKINIERWCIYFIKRFKKRTSIVLKKLQIENYIYVDVRRKRKFRTYMQNIFRHVKIANFLSIFHQCIIVWNNFELNFRVQIFELFENIILITFLNQLNAKKNVWMNMTIRHRDQINNSNFSNNADRFNRSSKQNRNKNDSNQQFYVNFFYSNQAYMWSLSNYNSYQYRNSVYQFQSNYQSRQFSKSYQQKSFDSFSTVLSTAKQSFLLKFSNEFASNQKLNKSNVKKFDKFDKIKIYNVDENNETEKVEKDYFDEKNADDYHVSKNISYYQSTFYNDFEDENDNAVYLITSKMLLSKSNKIIICRKCNNDFFFNNKLHEHLRFNCFDKISLIYSTNVFNQFFSIIMIIQNINVIIRSSTRKFLTTSKSNEFTNSFITQSRIEIIDFDSVTVSETSKFFTDVHFDFFEKTKFASIFIIVSNVDFNKNVDINHDFRNWNYARIHVILFFTIDVEFVCLDIDAEIIFCDR